MTESYWQLKNRSNRRVGRESDVPERCDIAVIGGGIAGIATAYFLDKMGCNDVVVLEKEYIGFGASGRNAGFLLAGLSEPYSRLITGMGSDFAKKLMSATAVNHDLIAEAVSENNINCDYIKSGSYHLAMTDVEKREYSESAALLNRDGFEAVFIDDPAQVAEGSFSGFSGGYYFPADGMLDPFSFINGLASKLKIIEGFEVRRLDKSGGDVEISGTRGDLRAEMAVLATNGYSPLLDKFFEQLIFPVRGQMMATSSVPEDYIGDRIYYANFGYDYFRRSVDQNILIGGLRNRFLIEETGYVDELNEPLQSGLADYVRNRLGIKKFGIEGKWSGLMGDTIDGLPLVGSLPHNSSVITAAGFNGHGFGLAMVVARDLAKAILAGETSDILKRFSMKRFL